MALRAPGCFCDIGRRHEIPRSFAWAFIRARRWRYGLRAVAATLGGAIVHQFGLPIGKRPNLPTAARSAPLMFKHFQVGVESQGGRNEILDVPSLKLTSNGVHANSPDHLGQPLSSPANHRWILKSTDLVRDLSGKTSPNAHRRLRPPRHHTRGPRTALRAFAPEDACRAGTHRIRPDGIHRNPLQGNRPPARSKLRWTTSSQRQSDSVSAKTPPEFGTSLSDRWLTGMWGEPRQTNDVDVEIWLDSTGSVAFLSAFELLPQIWRMLGKWARARIGFGVLGSGRLSR